MFYRQRSEFEPAYLRLYDYGNHKLPGNKFRRPRTGIR